MKKNIFQAFSKIFQISKIIIKHPLFKNAFFILLILTLLGTWRISPPIQQKTSGVKATPQMSVHQKDFYLTIPKIKVAVPIIADVDGVNKEVYMKALEDGVGHLKNTAKPGEGSNTVIFGHSSYYANEPGNFKEVFRELDQLSENDEIVIWYKNTEYKYQVKETKIIKPEDIWVIEPTKKEQLTISTCYPPGTTQKRLVIFADFFSN